MDIPYQLVRSSRRTLSLQIDSSGDLVVRSPMRLGIERIEEFIETKRNWIIKHQLQQKDIPQRPLLITSDIQDAKKRLRDYIVPRTYELWEGKNLPKINSIKITISEKRWGSCSARNGLCFSYRLAEYISSNSLFIDAIIVHELAHLREKHHQKSFWNLVYSMMGEYESVMRDHKEKIDRL